MVNNLWYTNPWTSLAWTIAELDGLAVGMAAVYYATPPEVRVSQVILRINYTASQSVVPILVPQYRRRTG